MKPQYSLLSFIKDDLIKEYLTESKTYLDNNEFVKAKPLLNNAKKRAIKQNNLEVQAIIHSLQAEYYYRVKKFKLALNHYHKVYDLSQQIDHKYLLAVSCICLGSIYYFLSNFTKAFELFTTGVNLKRELQDYTGLAKALYNLGLLYHDQGQYYRAQDFYEQALEIYLESDNDTGKIKVYNSLGLLHTDLGNYSNAYHYYNKALMLARSLQDYYHETMILNNLAMVLIKQNQLEIAKHYLALALVIIREKKYFHCEAYTLESLAYISILLNDWPKAEEYCSAALDYAHSIDDKIIFAYLMCNWAIILNHQNNRVEAEKHLKKARVIQKRIKADDNSELGKRIIETQLLLDEKKVDSDLISSNIN